MKVIKIVNYERDEHDRQIVDSMQFLEVDGSTFMEDVKSYKTLGFTVTASSPEEAARNGMPVMPLPKKAKQPAQQQPVPQQPVLQQPVPVQPVPVQPVPVPVQSVPVQSVPVQQPMTGSSPVASLFGPIVHKTFKHNDDVYRIEGETVFVLDWIETSCRVMGADGKLIDSAVAQQLAWVKLDNVMITSSVVDPEEAFTIFDTIEDSIGTEDA